MIARAVVVLAIAALQSDALFQPSDRTQVLVFIASDCPISNGYAPEIQRICSDFSARGVRCTLVYEDVGFTEAAVAAHLAEYRYRDLATVIDHSRSIARRAGVTVTPEAVVVDTRGTIRYRGRIDNFYAALGKPRQRVTSRDLRDALDAVLAAKRVERPRTTALGCYITFDRPRGGDR
jgi:AhpC/TSA family